MDHEEITSFGRLVFRENIHFVYLNEGLVLTPQIVRDINERCVSKARGRRHGVLADVSLNVSSTVEAREYAADNEHMVNHIAYAMIGRALR